MAALTLIVMLATAFPARAEQNGSRWDARIVRATGSVSVLLASEGLSKPYPAQDGLPLFPGDSVTTGNDGQAFVTLSGRHSISVLPNSEITVSSVSKSETLFDLAMGRVLALISPLASTERLSIETPQAVAAVRGTEFGVDATASGASVGVFDEGRVEVYGPTGRVMIGPHQETSVAPGKPPRAPRALTNRFLRLRPLLEPLRRQSRRIRRLWPRYERLDRRALRRRFIAVRKASRRPSRWRRVLRRGHRPSFAPPRAAPQARRRPRKGFWRRRAPPAPGRRRGDRR